MAEKKEHINSVDGVCDRFLVVSGCISYSLHLEWQNCSNDSS